MSKSINNAYILAGGSSRRYGSDKLFLKCGDVTLLQKTVHTCRKQFKDVVIAAKNRDKFKEYDCKIILDQPDANGPLAGIISSLMDCKEKSCFITAADFYDLDEVTITGLIESYKDEQFLGLSEENGIQPLCGIYNKSALPYLISRANKRIYKMRDVIIGLDYRVIPAPVKTWRNINEPNDAVGII